MARLVNLQLLVKPKRNLRLAFLILKICGGSLFVAHYPTDRADHLFLFICLFLTTQLLVNTIDTGFSLVSGALRQGE